MGEASGEPWVLSIYLYNHFQGVGGAMHSLQVGRALLRRVGVVISGVGGVILDLTLQVGGALPWGGWAWSSGIPVAREG